MSDLPSQQALQAAWANLREIHAQYLRRHGVKIPNTDSYDARAKSIWLAVLHEAAGKPVHKNIISDVCQRDKPGLARDQQVRHLKRDGWRLAGEGGLHTLDPYQPSLEWINQRARRAGRLSAKTFAELKGVYGESCATCGAREGRPDPRYGADAVILQQGHMDPSKSADDRRNIIPQCQYCNRAYRGDFVFDVKGRAYALADIGPVQRASTAVKRKLYDWLTRFFSDKE